MDNLTILFKRCKWLLTSLVFMMFSTSALAQTGTQNYVQTKVVRVSGVTNNTQLSAVSTDTNKVNVTIQYFDGLYRPLQVVAKQASPTGRDIVQPFVYDEFGREALKYLPYVDTLATSDGSFKPNAIADQAAFYNNPSGSRWNAPGVVTIPVSGSITPSYARTGYESSALNRVVEQGAEGASWKVTGTPGPNSTDHTVRTVYAGNDTNMAFDSTMLTNNPGIKYVAQYATTINAATNTQRLIQTSAQLYYLPGKLDIKITRDENWQPANGCLGTSEIYTDKENHVVLVRHYNKTTNASGNAIVQVISTYYVYDYLGNLAFVLTPLAHPDNGRPSQTVLDNLCYQYHYDGRNRLVEKKIPGKGWEYTIYNKLDQAIATQDSVQRMQFPQRAFYTKYDAQGRIIMTGIYKLNDSVAGSNNRLSMQAAANAQTTLWETRSTSSTGYTNSTIPKTGTTLFVANYYDNNTAVPNLPVNYSAPSGASTMTNGLLTASKVAVLNMTTDYLWRVVYYDDLGRTIETYAQHYLGGHPSYSANNYDRKTIAYNFSNQIDTTIRYHYNKTNLIAPVLTIGNTYLYDHTGRKLNTGEQIAGSNGIAQTAVYLSKMDYNQIGQLMAKHYHLQPGMTNYLGEMGYSYNERGWISALTPLGGSTIYYGELINYDKPMGSGTTAQYNGNISQFSYNSPYMNSAYGRSLTNYDTVNYTYDNLNRLKTSQSGYGSLDESVTYDQMGDINTLVRSGQYAASLAYTYQNSNQSNQLSSVKNNGAVYRNYVYDGNGNVTSDSTNRSLTYNVINLPLVYKKGSTTLCTYYYDAEGNKLRDTSFSGRTSWDYIDGIVYSNTGTGQSSITYIQTEEGKASILPGGATFSYTYDLKDYLGNIRASFDNGGSGGAPRSVQENSYYPFGLTTKFYDAANGNRYLYNGKEQQLDLTNQYDYGARFYDPVIARWSVVDPLSEINRRSSPYAYVSDNPIRNIDPDGMSESVPNSNVTITDPADIMAFLADAKIKWDIAFLKYQNDKRKNGDKGKKTKGKPKKRNQRHAPDWEYSVPIISWSAETMDAFDNGDYWTAAGREANGMATTIFGAEMFVEKGITTGLVGLFTTNAETATSVAVFDVTKTYMSPSEMSTYIRELEAGFKDEGVKLATDHNLTTSQLEALSENLKQTLTKTIPNATTKQAIINQLANPRWRFIDQIPGGRAAIYNAIKGLGITFKY